VVRDSVENLERNAVHVADVPGLDAADAQLLEVTLADVGAQVAMEADRVVLIFGRLQLAGRADAQVDVLQLAPEAPAGEDEAQVLVRGFGPAVEVVADGPLP